MNNKNELIKLLARLWPHISVKRRRQFGLVFILMMLSALTDVISLGAVLPFIGVLVAPEQVLAHPFMEPIVEVFEIKTPNELILPLTVGFAFTAIMAAVMRIFLVWVNTRLASAIGTDMSFDAYNRTLHQPYHVHIARNSSSVISGITGKVNSVVSQVLLPLLTLLSSLILFIGVTVTLFAINPLVASAGALSFSLVYAIVSVFVRSRLQRNSQLIAREQTKVIKALQEGLGGIRDVLLGGAQKIYSDTYRKADHPLRLAQANNVFVVTSPRHFIEGLGIVLLVSFAYILSLSTGGISESLPLLAVLALGAQRLLPALQQCYSAWSTIAGNQASLADTLEILDQQISVTTRQILGGTLPLKQGIQFKDVSFRYTEVSPWVLNAISLSIPSGTNVGIVGSTGSGKSTLLDLLMGLLVPTQGEIIIDGLKLEGHNLRRWQNTIANVPQNIFLTDASIAENIAFGVALENIDFDRVIKCARTAQISKYIEESEDGYKSLVGERGVRLSGGQRQRIGIARALYKNASVLVLDEATSALDNRTESLVIDSINELKEGHTIFFIAHRLTTIMDCDIIIELDNGKVSAQGTYKELLEQSVSFREMNVNV